jgi:hypothetical protein
MQCTYFILKKKKMDEIKYNSFMKGTTLGGTLLYCTNDNFDPQKEADIRY